MIKTYEEERHNIKKEIKELQRRCKDIKLTFHLEAPRLNKEAKTAFYKGCYLKHLRKKHKAQNVLHSEDYVTYMKHVRFEYKKVSIYKTIEVDGVLLPSHRLYRNQEMRLGYSYNDSFIYSTMTINNLNANHQRIIETLQAFKQRTTAQKKVWLERSSMNKISLIRYEEAMEALSEGGSLSPNGNDTARYVGVEIECLSKLDFKNMRTLIAKEAPSLSKYLKLGEDGSIRTEEGFRFPIEFRLLMKETDKEKVLNLFQKVIGPHIKVNDSCGLHVHLDMRTRNYTRSFERLVDVTPILMSMVPKSRRENNYCVINKNKKEHSKAGRNGVGRYRVINPESFRKYKTLEVRVHSATKNASKIINWINLLTLVIDKEFADNRVGKRITEPKRRITNLISFFTKYEVPASLRNYITMRIAKFGRFKELKVPMELETIIPTVATEVTTSQDEAI